MKSVMFLILAFGFLVSNCTKTDTVTAPQYDTVYVRQLPDTTKQFIIVADNWGDSACDIYVNGDLTTTLFAHEASATFTAPSGALLQARQMSNGWLQVQTDTALVADTSSQAYFYASGDTLFWTIY